MRIETITTTTPSVDNEEVGYLKLLQDGYWDISDISKGNYALSMYIKCESTGNVSLLSDNKSISNEWQQISFIFVKDDSDMHVKFSAGIYYLYEAKLEKGNKATDWIPAPEDAVPGISEAAKTATNFMSYDSANGLLVGNKTSGSWSGNRAQITSDKFNILDGSGTQLASYGTNTVIGKTSGNNVLIDDDSVDIRKGTDVVASYGEDVVIYKNSKAAFKITDSYLKNLIANNTTNTIIAEHFAYELNNKWYQESVDLISALGGLKTFNADETYIWKITYANPEVDPLYIIFVPSETFTAGELIYNDLTLNDDRLYYRGPSVAFLDPVNIKYKTVGESLIDLSLNGNVFIENTGDINGLYKGYPPFAIGSKSGYRLEMDYNEIMAKSDNTTPSHLFLNMEGGNVSINNNCDRAVMIQEGAIFAKNKNYNDGNWLGVVDCVNESGNTTFGYGGYLNEIGGTNIYGNTVKLFSKDNINSNTSYVIPNGKSFCGTNTSGEVVNNFQPCNTNNNCVVGYGSYEKGEGATNIYGNEINMTTSGTINLTTGDSSKYIYLNGNVVVPWTRAWGAPNSSGKIVFNFGPCNSQNKCVIGHGSYLISEGSTDIYGTKINLTSKNGYTVSDATSFRNAIGASNGIFPISVGGSGQSGISSTTTISNIVTAATNVTISSATYACWGKLAEVRITMSIGYPPGVGNISNITLGTLVSGKRPAMATYSTSYDYGISFSISAAGVITLQAISIAMNSSDISFVISATYILP